MMKAYRIGKIQQPWTNLEPPIRSSVLQQGAAADEKNGIKQIGALDEKKDGKPAKTLSADDVARAKYTAELEAKEIAEGLRDNPSLDPETQRAITREYRALHEKVKDMGLYQCRYQEYGKELIRYSLLFGAFLYLLRAEWYLTSAIFLGMFWVSPTLYASNTRAFH